MDVINILGQTIDDITTNELIENWGSYRFLIPVNVDVLMKLRKDNEFNSHIKNNRAITKVVNDSQVIRFASRIILNKTLNNRVSGSDFLPFLCRESVISERARVFLLGGMGDSAELARKNINSRLGKNIVVGAFSPTFGFQNNPTENALILKMIFASNANVLAVGVGAPKQEKWIYTHCGSLPTIKLFIAVGATIDFEAGLIKRAPKWISNAGLEWLYRLVIEPRRLARRYLIEGIPFFWLLLKQRLNQTVD